MGASSLGLVNGEFAALFLYAKTPRQSIIILLIIQYAKMKFLLFITKNRMQEYSKTSSDIPFLELLWFFWSLLGTL